MYKLGVLESLYNDDIYADDIFDNGIQLLQHWEKKYVNCSGIYVEENVFRRISWEYLGRLWNVQPSLEYITCMVEETM